MSSALVRLVDCIQNCRIADSQVLDELRAAVGANELTDVNEFDGSGWTLLHSAAKAGRLSAVRYLLDHGADPSARTRASQNLALHYFVRNNFFASSAREAVASTLRRLFPAKSAAAAAVRKTSSARVPAASTIRSGPPRRNTDAAAVEYNARNDRNETVLHSCVFGAGGEEMLAVVLEAGRRSDGTSHYELDAESRGAFTPLAIALQRGAVRQALLFVDAGASVSAQDITAADQLLHATQLADAAQLLDLLKRTAQLPGRLRHSSRPNEPSSAPASLSSVCTDPLNIDDLLCPAGELLPGELVLVERATNVNWSADGLEALRCALTVTNFRLAFETPSAVHYSLPLFYLAACSLKSRPEELLLVTKTQVTHLLRFDSKMSATRVKKAIDARTPSLPLTAKQLPLVFGATADVQRGARETKQGFFSSLLKGPKAPAHGSGDETARERSWGVHDAVERDYQRLGIDIATGRWRWSSQNLDFFLSPELPARFIAPDRLPSPLLIASVSLFEQAQLPLPCWQSPQSALLSRSGRITLHADALTSMSKSALTDSADVLAYYASLPRPGAPFVILCYNHDSQPHIANRRNLPNLSVERLAMPSDSDVFRAYRYQLKSRHRLPSAVRASPSLVAVASVSSSSSSAAAASASTSPAATTATTEPHDKHAAEWPQCLEALLNAAVQVCKHVQSSGHVLVTGGAAGKEEAKLVAVAQLLLDPYYRTFAGFAVLVRKEFLQVGYTWFYKRKSDKQDASDNAKKAKLDVYASSFMLFLDAVRQLCYQFPHAFEFDLPFLSALAHSVTSGRFGTFLLASPQQRASAGIEQTSACFFSLLDDQRFRLCCTNPRYAPDDRHAALHPQPTDIQPWPEHFLRGCASSLVPLLFAERGLSGLRLAYLAPKQLAFWTARQLTAIDLSGQALTDCSARGCPFPLCLETVDCSHNAVRVLELPTRAPRLRVLNASHNAVAALPAAVFASCSRTLTTLDLSHNQLRSLAGLDQLACLQSLNASHNQLQSFSAAELASAWASLRHLDLSHNRIGVLPANIASFAALHTLLLAGNCLVRLSHGIGLLPALVDLDVSDNALEALPMSLQLRHASQPLRSLVTAGNPDLVVGSGTGSDASTAHSLLLKLVLVGSEGAGKSTLLKRISEPACSLSSLQQNASTNGIDIKYWDVDEHVRLRCFDFGGQELFHGTHEFFLSERAIYVVVFSVINAESYTHRISYWLKTIGAFHAAASPLAIVVGTHADRTDAESLASVRDFVRREMLAQFSWAKGPFLISSLSQSPSSPDADTVNDIEALIAEIAASARAHPLLKRTVPAGYLRIGAMLAKLAGTHQTISWDDFVDVCRDYLFAGPDADTLAACRDVALFFHECGQLLYFDNLIVLNPKFLADLLATIHSLSHRWVVAGHITHAALTTHIWRDYPSAIHADLLKLLVQFGVLFPVYSDDDTHPSSSNSQPPSSSSSMSSSSSSSISASAPSTPSQLSSPQSPSVSSSPSTPQHLSSSSASLFSPSTPTAVASFTSCSGFLVPGLLPACTGDAVRSALKSLSQQCCVSPFIRQWRIGFISDGFFPRLVSALLHMPAIALPQRWRNMVIGRSSSDEGDAAFALCFDAKSGLDLFFYAPCFAPLAFVALLSLVDGVLTGYYPKVRSLRVVRCRHCWEEHDGNVAECGSFTLGALIQLHAAGKSPLCPLDGTPLSTEFLAPDLTMSYVPRVHVELGPEIGRGGFGRVFKAHVVHSNMRKGACVAVKELLLSPGDNSSNNNSSSSSSSGRTTPATNARGDASIDLAFREFQKEVTLMYSLRHPNLVRLYGVSATGMAMVMELVPCGDLARLLDRYERACLLHDWSPPGVDIVQLHRNSVHRVLDVDAVHKRLLVPYGEKQIWLPRSMFIELPSRVLKDISWQLRLKIAVDIARGMRYLARANILHRDLRSPNVFIMSCDPSADVNAKVADFGLSSLLLFGGRATAGALATWQWLAPEVLLSTREYGASADVYSFGIVLWEIASRQLPFVEDQAIFERFQRDGFFDKHACIEAIAGPESLRPRMPDGVPRHVEKVIARAWTTAPDQRPSWSWIIKKLEKAWLQETGVPLPADPEPAPPPETDVRRKKASMATLLDQFVYREQASHAAQVFWLWSAPVAPSRGRAHIPTSASAADVAGKIAQRQQPSLSSRRRSLDSPAKKSTHTGAPTTTTTTTTTITTITSSGWQALRIVKRTRSLSSISVAPRRSAASTSSSTGADDPEAQIWSATAGSGPLVRQWTVATRTPRPPQQALAHKTPLLALVPLALSGDRQWLVTVDIGEPAQRLPGQLCVWDLAAGSAPLLSAVVPHSFPLRAFLAVRRRQLAAPAKRAVDTFVDQRRAVLLGAQRRRPAGDGFLFFSVDVSGFLRVWTLDGGSLQCLRNVHFFPNATWFGCAPLLTTTAATAAGRDLLWLGDKSLRSLPVDDLLSRDIVEDAPIGMKLVEQRPFQLGWFDWCAQEKTMSLGVVVPAAPLSVWTATRNSLTVWDGSSLRIRQTLSTHTANVTAVFHCPSRSPVTVLTGDQAGSVLMWNASQLSLLHRFKTPQLAPLVALAMVATDELWCSNANGLVSVWRVRDGQSNVGASPARASTSR